VRAFAVKSERAMSVEVDPVRIQASLGWRSPWKYEARLRGRRGAAGEDLSIPATAKPAPVLDAVKQTTLDRVCGGPEHARNDGNPNSSASASATGVVELFHELFRNTSPSRLTSGAARKLTTSRPPTAVSAPPTGLSTRTPTSLALRRADEHR
jgi:hypothetical protein